MEALITTPFVREVQAICVDPSPARPPLPPWLKSVPTLVVAGESAARVGPSEVNNWLAERKIGGGIPRSGGAALEDRRTPLAAPVYNPDMAPRPDATSRSAAPPTLRNTVVTSPPSYTAPVSASSYSPLPSTGGGSSKLPPAISASTPATAAMAPPKLAGSSEDGPAAYHGTEMGGVKWSDAYSFVNHTDYTAEKGYDPIVRNFELLGGPLAGGGGSTAAAAPKRSAKEDALLRDFEAYAASRDRDVAPPVMRKS